MFCALDIAARTFVVIFLSLSSFRAFVNVAFFLYRELRACVYDTVFDTIQYKYYILLDCTYILYHAINMLQSRFLMRMSTS
jgi:hypothetical protein